MKNGHKIIIPIIAVAVIVVFFQTLITIDCLAEDGTPQFFGCVWVFVNFIIPQVFAEPVSHEEFMKMYQPKLDIVLNENLPPTKQSQIGILFNDIFCHENKIHVLKLTGQNYIACASPESAIKLVERGWGLVHRDNPHQGQAGAECTQWWIVHHDNNGIPLESTMIKTIRVTTNEFSNEFVVWDPVRIVNYDNNTITISSHGSFNEFQRDIIIENLSNIEHVLNIEHKPRGCT